ncbi:MAG: M20/M25/M40 family metallo-hydrolase [Polyangiaceae bacterium]|nr:M20/M25/M40 family metallo-hydrolase [Polyangiaceae bacterium]
MSHRDPALVYLEKNFERTLGDLMDLVRIPSVSTAPAPDADMERSAEAVAAWMRRVGLEGVELLRVPGAHPYVYGEWLRAPAGAPTVLLYAHHDVQPVGRLGEWKSPPFEPEVRDGRVYGRGVVDDKAGAAVHFAAIEAYLRSGGLPINVKVLIDGEEEVSSEHLGPLLEAQRERMAADLMVLTDTANLAAGVPSITYALRGIVIVDVEVAAVDHPLHSGMWGGPTPDAPLALCKILGGLLEDDGRIDVPGLYDKVRPLGPRERARLAALPFDAAEFRRDAGVLAGVGMAGEAGYSTYELLWLRPSLDVNALEAAPLKGASNQIVPSARARVGIRIVPDQDPDEVARLLCARLTASPPWGVQVTATVKAAAGWWVTDPEGPAFEAARRALEAGFGSKVAFIGCGGSIPFVEPFARVLGGVPALLVGLEDPACNAHSENESLLVSDFQKALRSAVYLYDELSRLPRR